MTDPQQPSMRLTDDLEIVRAATIVTGRYQDSRPELGVAVRTTMGGPERYGWWPKGTLLVWPKPWAIPPWYERRLGDQAEAAYTARLEREAERVIHQLAGLVTTYPEQPLVLLCYENVHTGGVCHRRWFADWIEQRWGVAVPELPPA